MLSRSDGKPPFFPQGENKTIWQKQDWRRGGKRTRRRDPNWIPVVPQGRIWMDVSRFWFPHCLHPVFPSIPFCSSSWFIHSRLFIILIPPLCYTLDSNSDTYHFSLHCQDVSETHNDSPCHKKLSPIKWLEKLLAATARWRCLHHGQVWQPVVGWRCLGSYWECSKRLVPSLLCRTIHPTSQTVTFTFTFTSSSKFKFKITFKFTFKIAVTVTFKF